MMGFRGVKRGENLGGEEEYSQKLVCRRSVREKTRERQRGMRRGRARRSGEWSGEGSVADGGGPGRLPSVVCWVFRTRKTEQNRYGRSRRYRRYRGYRGYSVLRTPYTGYNNTASLGKLQGDSLSFFGYRECRALSESWSVLVAVVVKQVNQEFNEVIVQNQSKVPNWQSLPRMAQNVLYQEQSNES